MANTIYMDLPNNMPTPNINNLASEAEKYYELYTKLDRTITGQLTFKSNSSNTTYKTTSYPNDIDVYNKGETGLMNLLYKYKLKPYIITADTFNDMLNRATNAPIDATSVVYENVAKIYYITLSREPLTNYYSIRFKSPNNYVAGATMRVTYTTSSGTSNTDICVPRLSGSNADMPGNAFVNNRILTVNVDKTAGIMTFTSSAGGGIEISNSEPQNKSGFWLNPDTGELKYWDGTRWRGVVGVWG